MLPTYLIQFAYNFAVVGPIILVPLIARDLKASPAVIGSVVAGYQAVLFLSSWLFGRLADLKGHRRLIIIGLLAATGVLAAHTLIRSIPGLFAVRAAAGLAIGIFPAAVVAYAANQGGSLGRFASIGALGWGIGSLVTGALGLYNRVFLLSSAMFFAAFLVAFFRLRETRERVNRPLFNLDVMKRNWRVYVSYFLRHAGAMGIWAIFPLFLDRLGANKFWIGIIYALNAFGQFVFMPLLDRFTSRRLVQLGLYGSVLTFLGFALCRNFWQLMPLQLLLAFSWSALYVGSLKYLVERNAERSTAIGVLNSTMSLSGITGAVMGGAIAGLGFPALMVSAALMAVAGALVFRF